MDQIPEKLDPEVAQEMITLLSRKIANLRNENAQLQSQLSSSSVKSEDESNGSSNNTTQCLRQEIEHLKSELERKPDPEDVAELKGKFKRSKQRWQELEQNLRSQVEQLLAELEETQSARQGEQAIKEALEEEIKKLCEDLNHTTREKEEALERFESQRSENFDVHQFLSSTLGELPPMPNPIVMAGEEKTPFKSVVTENRGNKIILSVSGGGMIKWVNGGGACVIPFPPVIYNGQKHVVETSRNETAENCLYELFGVNGHRVYYGTFRCIKLVIMDWTDLTSLGQEFTDAFLEITVTQDGYAAPVIRSLVEGMYQTGVLKAGCAAFRYEGFDQTIVRKIRSAGGPSGSRNTLVRDTSGTRRPSADEHGGEYSQAARKRQKFGSSQMRTRASRQIESARRRIKVNETDYQ